MKKSVVITGVNGGIGDALARKFRENDYNVIGMGRRDGSPNCDQYYSCDLDRFVADEIYREQLSSELSKGITSLNTLVNNAALQILSPFSEIKLEDWQKSLNVNLTAPMLLSQLFLDKLIAAKGSVINIGSIHQVLTKPRFVTYATSKSALVGLTKTMAVDLEGKVMVNSVSPAAIETEMLLAGFDGDKQALKELSNCHPVKRIGTTEEVAELALFLSDKNTGFINGANFTIDGGISSVLHDL